MQINGEICRAESPSQSFAEINIVHNSRDENFDKDLEEHLWSRSKTSQNM